MKADMTNSIINIAGLALGLGIVTIIIVFVLNETGYNSSFENKDRIYRILNRSNYDNGLWANTPYVLGSTVAEKFAEVEAETHQLNIGNSEVRKNNDFFPEPDMVFTESSFFKIFKPGLLSGSLSGFDFSKDKIVISAETAKRYFGSGDPLGKMISIRNKGVEYPLEVIAVFKDFPQNSTIHAKFIGFTDLGINMLKSNMISTSESLPGTEEIKGSWEYNVFFTNYILVKKGTIIAELEKKIHQLGTEHSSQNSSLSLSLQPFNDIYFGSGRITDNNASDLGNLPMLYILVSVGFLILLIACINYLNLTSAQALAQRKALAVRKVCGAPEKTLITQIAFESTVLSLVAFPIALFLAAISLPYISGLLGKSYNLSLNNQLLTALIILLAVTLLSGVVSGWLVSLNITSFNLSEALKGETISISGKNGLRRALVVFQICIFIVLMSVVTLVRKQVNYAFSMDLGFAKEGLLRVYKGDHNYKLFKEEISRNPDVIDVSGAMSVPPSRNKMSISMPKVDEPAKTVTVNGLFADIHFARTMGFKITQGSDFNETNNNNGVLVNESAVKELGLKSVLGEQTVFGPVTGVVSDFNMYSIHEPIQPMIIGYNPSMVQQIAIRIRTNNLKQTIDFLENKWKETGGTTPFRFELTDSVLENLYQSDIRFSKTTGLMAIIAILIASLGLFGLSLFTSRQRTKEIGIRRVAGSGTWEIMALLNRDFVIQVTIAFVVAVPVAWYAMHRWLESFAYKTEISWWIFLLAGLIAFAITLLTVSWQSWRAATRNPVEALRYE